MKVGMQWKVSTIVSYYTGKVIKTICKAKVFLRFTGSSSQKLLTAGSFHASEAVDVTRIAISAMIILQLLLFCQNITNEK